ncbi:MAG: DegT/DnrJ/EryC1/StrS family aminotransferase, partial [Nitrospira sp.]
TDRIALPVVGANNFHVFNQFTVRVQKRDELRGYLKEQGVGSEVYYPLPLHLQSCYRDLGCQKGAFPQSERAAEEVLSLPIYAELSDEQLQYVVQTIASFYRKR